MVPVKGSPKKLSSQKRKGLGNNKDSVITGSTTRLPPKIETDAIAD